jgi:response regulator RpfG family c-di-GMP phosphodiesterase
MSAPRILAVDDEQDILALLREILSEEGYAVDTAARRPPGGGASASGSPIQGSPPTGGQVAPAWAAG